MLTDDERQERRRATTQRYRERNREALRVKNREYADRKRREAGMPALGTPESTANRRNARKASGTDHGNWRGGDVGYFALHAWVERHKQRTGVCSECGTRPEPKKRKNATEWANLSGEYHRDLNDYVELCCSCHRKRDMTPEKRAKISAAMRRRWEQSRAA